MSKLGTLVAGGIGYVLGARAGRERYDQIKALAVRVKDNPTVQQNTRQAADAARDAAGKAAPVVKDKVVGAASTVKDKATGGPGGSGSTSDPGDTPQVPMEGSGYPAAGVGAPTEAASQNGPAAS